jgi:acyl transferase domain-containing protein
VAFVFSGNGAQWPGMAQAVALRNPAFRAALRAVDAQLKPLLGWSVAKRLAQGVDAPTLAETEHAQPLLFAVQIGLVAALAAQGIRPALVLGHSVGEVASAHVAGLLDLKGACRLIVARSRQQQAMRGQGRMRVSFCWAEVIHIATVCWPGPDAILATLAGLSCPILRRILSRRGCCAAPGG